MDTIFYPNLNRPQVERTATSAAGIGIALCLLISQNLLISAQDIGIGSGTGITPSINYILYSHTNK